MDWLKRLQIADDNEINKQDIADGAGLDKLNVKPKMTNSVSWADGEVPILPHTLKEPTLLDVNIETIHMK